MIPAQMLTEVEGNEDAEDDQRDDLLNYLELDRRKVSGADAVGRHLEAVFEQGDSPTDQDDLPKSFLAELQVAVPGEGHEDVGEDEKNDGPHNQIVCRRGELEQAGNAMTALKENLERLEEEIAQACRRAARPRTEVQLMAVSKTYPAAVIAEAAALGLKLFGENRVQEFAGKASDAATLRAACQDEEIRVYLIGHLQSNKAQRAVEIFDAIDSLDSLRLAERLNEAAAKLGKRLPVLIEVKLSSEETKAGLDPNSDDATRLLERLPELDHLQVRGLMTIAPFDVSEAETRACFRSLREWRERWSVAYPKLSLDVLSMGMSGDFGLAIEEGATRIRVGTSLFGSRPALRKN
jgi:PLP dependent protein